MTDSRSNQTRPVKREPRNRRQPRDTRRAELQAAALELVDARGYDAVTAQEIAAAAGVTERTFFRVFPTKESALLWYIDDDDLPALAEDDRDCRDLAERDARYVIREESDRRRLLRRLRIIQKTPALRAQWITKNLDRANTAAKVYSDAHPDEDALTVRVQVTAVYAASLVAAGAWAAAGGRTSLDAMLSDAFALVRGGPGRGRR